MKSELTNKEGANRTKMSWTEWEGERVGTNLAVGHHSTSHRFPLTVLSPVVFLVEFLSLTLFAYLLTNEYEWKNVESEPYEIGLEERDWTRAKRILTARPCVTILVSSVH